MEKLMSLTMKATALALVALTASCNLDAGGGDGPSPTPTANSERKQLAEPARIETGGPPPSANTLAAEGALRTRLSSILQPVDGARVAFIDCSSPACSARLVAPSRSALKDLLQSVSRDHGGRITFVARERLDAYTGRTFEADVVLGSDEVRAVPQDEEELLTNNGD